MATRGLRGADCIRHGYTDTATMDRIHKQVPGAAVIFKPDYRSGLAAAVQDAIAHRIG
jgi:hypothetical protein